MNTASLTSNSYATSPSPSSQTKFITPIFSWESVLSGLSETGDDDKSVKSHGTHQIRGDSIVTDSASQVGVPCRD